MMYHLQEPRRACQMTDGVTLTSSPHAPNLGPREYAPKHTLADTRLTGHDVTGVGSKKVRTLVQRRPAPVKHRLEKRRVALAHEQRVVRCPRPVDACWKHQMPPWQLGDLALEDGVDGGRDVKPVGKLIERRLRHDRAWDCRPCKRVSTARGDEHPEVLDFIASSVVSAGNACTDSPSRRHELASHETPAATLSVQ